MRNPVHNFRLRTAALAAAGATTIVLLAGCGLKNPDYPNGGLKTTTSAAPTQTKTNPEPAHEQDGTIPASSQASDNNLAAGAGSVQQTDAIEQYANLWCNWTSSNLLSHEQKLEDISLGGARTQEQMALAAPREAGTRITNTCQVVSLGRSKPHGPAAGAWVLVTSSTTTSPNSTQLAPQIHVTYVNLTRHQGRWVVNEWSPQL